MYLLEIDLLRQENLSKQGGFSQRKVEQGAYYLESNSENNPLQGLAKEFWHYQESPLHQVRAKVPDPACQNETLFQQQVQDTAQKLVTNLVRKPLTVTQILDQLEQELPEFISLGKPCVETDILKLVDHYHSTLEEWMAKNESGMEGSINEK